eukprot:1145168-Pelagomonas_calceolata.AAC.1
MSTTFVAHVIVVIRPADPLRSVRGRQEQVPGQLRSSAGGKAVTGTANKFQGLLVWSMLNRLDSRSLDSFTAALCTNLERQQAPCGCYKRKGTCPYDGRSTCRCLIVRKIPLLLVVIEAVVNVHHVSLSSCVVSSRKQHWGAGASGSSVKAHNC